MNNMFSALQVLLFLVAFVCAVLADPHRGGPYGPRPGLGWYRNPPGPFYGRTDDPRIIVIIEDRRTTTPVPVTAATTTVAPVIGG
jgi:hypothetical protein